MTNYFRRKKKELHFIENIENINTFLLKAKNNYISEIKLK